MDITITIKDVDPEFMEFGRAGVEAANKVMNNVVQVPDTFSIKWREMMEISSERTIVFFSHAMSVYCTKNRIKLDQ